MNADKIIEQVTEWLDNNLSDNDYIEIKIHIKNKKNTSNYCMNGRID